MWEAAGLRFFQGKLFSREQSTEPLPDASAAPRTAQGLRAQQGNATLRVETCSLERSRSDKTLLPDGELGSRPWVRPSLRPGHGALGRGHPSLWRPRGLAGTPEGQKQGLAGGVPASQLSSWEAHSSRL